jgi:hypothetical protein
MPIDRLVHSPGVARLGGILSRGVPCPVDAIRERQDGPQEMPLFYTGKVGKLCIADCCYCSVPACLVCWPAVTIAMAVAIARFIRLPTVPHRPSSNRVRSPRRRFSRSRPSRRRNASDWRTSACGLALSRKQTFSYSLFSHESICNSLLLRIACTWRSLDVAFSLLRHPRPANA